MSNLAIVEKEWKPLVASSPYEVPSNHPVICMEHKQTKKRAYFDIKLDRFLSQQEAAMALGGYEWMLK